jgi:arylsulfatase A-like enzyme
MKLRILLTALLLAPLLALHAVEPAARPNILVILADDLGYRDLGCQGAPDIPTPHIDSLAENGVRFTSGYVTSPICSPSRAGLLTGRSPSCFGHETNWEPGPESANLGLPLTEKTIADQLKAAGYRTGIVGKWHLGEAPPFHPNQRGFDEFFGFIGGGKDYFCDELVADPPASKSSFYRTLLERNGTAEKTSGYLTTLLGKECAAFIHRNKDRPWFLYAAFNAPHTPLQATPELLARVGSITDKNRQTYAAMVCGLDDAVGDILAQLRADGLEENTLIFFLSDNGGQTKWVKAASNEPLRGHKGQMWEGGIRVPFLMQWKGGLPAGQTYTRPVSSLDILPTALALAGTKSIAAQPLDGVNLIPFLRGESSGDPHENLFWRMKSRDIWAVRRGDDKLVKQKTRTPVLIDLASDLAESADLAGRAQSRRDELQEAYDTWAGPLPEPLWGEPPANPGPERRAE